MLRLPLEDLETLQRAALEREAETCAIAYVSPAGSANGSARFVARNLREAPEAAYARRNSMAAELKPEYCIELANNARAQGVGVLFAHTHSGFGATARFSDVDDAGEIALAAYFNRRAPTGTHFAAVVSQDDVTCRRLGCAELTPISAVGRALTRPGAKSTERADERYDRQARAFGALGQAALAATTVGIVGLGGTGSIVAQQLAHLGVLNYILIDPDNVEPTNLNRLVGAHGADVGAAKVEVAHRTILAIQPEARCDPFVGDIVDDHVAARLLAADFIFSCTDSMASRAVLNQLAYQFLIPCIDIGVAIGVGQGFSHYVTGRAQMLSPGLPCLVCTEFLNAEQVRRELLTDEQRKRDPYIVGASVPQPAVISLNSLVSSAATTMFVSAVAGLPSNARMLIYDGARGSLRPNAREPRPHCIVCSEEGALARGSGWDLPTRKEAA